MMDVLEYVTEKALILLPALWVIGAILKATPKFPSWLIPYVILVCGEAGALAIMGFTAEAAIQGVLVAGAAVFGHQLVKQAAICKDCIVNYKKDTDDKGNV